MSEKKSGFLGSLFSALSGSKPAEATPAVAEDFVDLSQAAPPRVDAVATTPSATEHPTAAAEAPASEAPAEADAPAAEEVIAEEAAPAPAKAKKVPPAEPAPLTMRDKTIALISGKGGVGRTSTVLSLAGAAAKRGKRVLIIDFDPQSSLTLATLDSTPDYTVDEVFQRTDIADVVTRVEWDAFADLVDIAAGTRDLVDYDNAAHPHQFELAFSRRFESLPEYDVVLVEAPPSLASLATIAVAIAKTTVVVAEPKLYSVRGAIEAVDFAEKVAADRELESTVRVLVNKVTDSTEARFRHKELRDTFGKRILKTHVDQTEVIEEANGAGVPVHAMPGTAAREVAATFNALLDELLP